MQVPDMSIDWEVEWQGHPSYQLLAIMEILPFVWSQKDHFPAGTSVSDTPQNNKLIN